MTFYERMKALADRQIAAKGSSVTIRGLPVAPDPVTGAGGSDGATRQVSAVLTSVDYRVFPESLVQAGDLMLLVEGGSAVQIGEKWVNGLAEWSIVAVREINPANGTPIAFRALVRG